jgi:hypothetical protein
MNRTSFIFFLLQSILLMGCTRNMSSNGEGKWNLQRDDPLLHEKVFEWIETQYENDVDLSTLSVPHQTFICIYYADGYLGNGGFQYLFEATFNGDPEYLLIHNAYRTIGAEEALRAFNLAFAAFPNGIPPTDKELRLELWENSRNESELGDIGYKANNMYWESDKSTMTHLNQFIIDNAHAFPF